MEMQDKITYTNNKKFHYYMKKLGLYLGLTIGASVIFAIPVSIVRTLVNQQNKIEVRNEVKEAEATDVLEF